MSVIDDASPLHEFGSPNVIRTTSELRAAATALEIPPSTGSKKSQPRSQITFSNRALRPSKKLTALSGRTKAFHDPIISLRESAAGPINAILAFSLSGSTLFRFLSRTIELLATLRDASIYSGRHVSLSHLPSPPYRNGSSNKPSLNLIFRTSRQSLSICFSLTRPSLTSSSANL